MSLYSLVASLPVTISDSDRTTQTQPTSSGFDRTTTTITLTGDGVTGRGEDVTYDTTAHDSWSTAPPLVDSLAGTWRFKEFADHLDTIDLFPTAAPPTSASRNYRRWGIESAALDLGLRQANLSLAEAFDRTASPVRFVVSTRLPDGDTTRVQDLLDALPRTEFKLDATTDWTADVTNELAATDAVRVIDFKGQYPDDDLRQPADPDLYTRVLDAFPTAVLEDPNLDSTTEPLLASETHRLAWDSPITDIDSIEALPWQPPWLNIKPSRFGAVKTLCDVLDYATDNDISLYGGGQFELGVGRRQLHDLAAAFYPDAPNDIAPTAYHSMEISPDLPTSPLPAPSPDPGFGS